MSFVLRQPLARSKDHFRLRFIAASAAMVWLGASCAVPHTVALQAPQQADCRIGIAPGGEPSPVLIRWVSPESARDRALLNDWCGGVGPAIVAPEPAAQLQPVNPNELAVVSWNVHVGGGDVASLVERLRLGEFTGGRPVTHFVLLLQETHRQGALVPRAPSVRSAGAIQPQLAGRERSDIVATARRLGLSLYYVPSMRNGSPDRTDEDRGNAILSTLPLADLTAIELPFERQRRVAIEATIAGTRPDGNPWSLRLTNAHLDNRAPARRLWLFSIATRLRQARGLLQGMRHDRPAAILGGDLNTWYGFDDPAYRELAAKFPVEATSDRRPTFAGLLRLDHLLFRLPEPWTVHVSRLDRFGSDHHPLLGWIKF